MAKAIKRKKSPLQQLQSFLEDTHGMSLSEVRGFIAALQSSPTLTLPSEWMPEVFNGDMPEFKNTEEARQVHKTLCMTLWNEIGRNLSQKIFTFAPGPDHEDLQQQWCQGYLKGIRFGNWSIDEHHKAWLYIHVISVLAGDVKAENAFDKEASPNSIFYAESKDEWLKKQRQRLPAYAVILYHIIREIDLETKS